MADPVKRESRSSAKTTKKTAPAKKPPQKIVLADLRKGVSDSESVRLLQRRLAKVVDKNLSPQTTGTYDGLTQRAVRAWQNDNGYVGGRGLRVDDKQAAQLFGDGYTFSADSDQGPESAE